MKIATQYMMDSVSYKGGFVWQYLPDLSRTWGEMEAKRTMVWIQPPGTPAIGHLLLDAYHATKDEYYYEAAQKVANALIWGQLDCGGWNYVFDFAGENSLKEWYQTIGKSGWRLEEFQHYYGNATFDDAGTIMAGKFLLRMYIEKNDPTYKAAVEKVINLVLESQYPIGGWPQRYPLMHNHPFKGNPDYSSFITLNDDVISENIDFLIQCYQSMGLQKIKEPIMRALYLTIALQQGEPMAGWAAQYTVEDLKPAAARSYEPQSICTAVTSIMIEKLLEYYKLTADSRFLNGIPAAIKFLESQRLPDSEVKKWDPSAPINTKGFYAPCWVDQQTGLPLYIHRKGSNSFNGTYYADQDIRQTIAHYGSVTYISTEHLKQEYFKTKKIPIKELIENSPLLSKRNIQIPTYYTRLPLEKAPKHKIKSLIEEINKNKYWLFPLDINSNTYKPIVANNMKLAESLDYNCSFVGDEYDTSPYPCTSPILGITTQGYINNMSILIKYLLNKN